MPEQITIDPNGRCPDCACPLMERGFAVLPLRNAVVVSCIPCFVATMCRLVGDSAALAMVQQMEHSPIWTPKNS